MSIYTKMLKEFHEAFDSSYHDKPNPNIPEKLSQLRKKLIHEELAEVEEAMEEKDIKNIAKELADLLYVVFGMADVYGLGDKMDEIFTEVHRSNMSKLDENGKVLRREDGKVLKSQLYSPANLDKIL